jgi:dihydroneopterin aldolase
LGTLYHQFVGAPVSARTAASLEEAMRESISLQPYVREVRVQIDRDMLAQNVFGYGELEGRMIIAEVQIEYEGEVIIAGLQFDTEKNYPLMSLL